MCPGDGKEASTFGRGQEMMLRVSTAIFQGPEKQAGQQGFKHTEMDGSKDGQEGLVRRLSHYSRE